MNRLHTYIDDVLSGRQVTGELIRLAVERHVRDLQNPAFWFDEQEAERVVRFFEKLRHWKGEWAGQTIQLEPHQVFYVTQLFGWKRTDNNLRRFRTSFKEVARKNAKTTECAGKVLYHLTKDNESGAQAYFAATKEDQARIGFRDCQEIIKGTPGLRSNLKVMTKSVIYNSGFIKPLGSDSNTQDGFDPSWGVIDEYHAHKSDEMLNVLESGMGARRQPVIDVITTAGFNKDYPCYSSLRRTSIEILKGIKQDDSLLALIYEIDEADDWADESTWIKSNPNLNVSVKLDFLRTRFKQAQNEGGTKEVDFRTKNLNQWTDSADTWIPDDVWMSMKHERPTFDQIPAGGIDLASVRDITAFVLLHPFKDGYYIDPYFFIPEETVAKKDEYDYSDWVRQGWMIQTPGNATDYNYIKAKVHELMDQYKVRKIACDRWNASQMIIDLLAEGVPIEQFGQGFASMSSPTKEFELLCTQKRLYHDGNPVLRWMVSNVAMDMDAAGNIKPNKAKSGNKIDGVVAAIMALAMSIPKEEQNTFNIRFL